MAGHPDGPWTTPQPRHHLGRDLGERTTRFRFLVRDRVGQFAPRSRRCWQARASRWLKIGPRYPRANCYAERLVLTVRTELTDWMLIFGEWHLGRVLCRVRQARQHAAAASRCC